MNRTKLRLSAEEMALVCNPEWILTKNLILEKVRQLLSLLQEQQYLIVENEKKALPAIIFDSNSKISKGENYRGLPYLILDYPRVFSGNSFLAIRSFFWWGNFFSITLHVSGGYKANPMQGILKNLALLSSNNFSISIADSEWEHHFGADNYVPIYEKDKEAIEKIMNDKTFIRVAKKISLSDWEIVEEEMNLSFIQLIQCLKA